MAEKIKGIVTRIFDNGNMGTINCGRGVKYDYSAGQLDKDYSPVLNDVVEFELAEDKPFAISLYHRQKGVSANPTDVDLKVKCPSCGESVLPKARVENGRVTEVYCPKCNQLMEKFDAPPKTSLWIWIVAVIVGIIVAGVVFQLVTQ